MIHVIATVELRPGKRDEFLGILRGNLPKVRSEDGCLAYDPADDVATGIAAQIPMRSDVVTIIERWRDLPALQAHLTAPHMVTYRTHVKDLVQHVSLQVLQPV